MPLPEVTRPLLLGGVLVWACLIAACGGKPGTVRSVQKVAQSYHVKDNRSALQRAKYRDLLELSAERLTNGALEQALQYARSAEKLDPAEGRDALTLQAVILAEQGQSESAGALYRRVAQMQPVQAEALNNYGAWLCSAGFQAEALVWFDRAIADQYYADRAAALANAGGCALQVGQRERAERDLALALQLAPTNGYALESMARNEFERGRYFEARAYYQRRLAAAPATASVLQLAIHIEDRLGDKEASQRYQRRLHDEFPSHAASNPQG